MFLGTVAMHMAWFLFAATAADSPRSNTHKIAFTVPGQGQQSLEQYGSKTLAVEIISTACLPCETSAQSLNSIQKEFGKENFQAILIAVNPNAESTVEEFTRRLQLAIPIGWTTRAEARQFLEFAPEQNFLLPQIVLLDRQKQVRFQTTAREMDDLRKEAVLRQRVQSLLRVEPQARVSGKSKESK
jgi:hypothetical protein